MSAQNLHVDYSAQRGYTLIELLTTVAIFCVVYAFASPWLAETSASFKRHDARQALAFDLRLARARAVSEGARAIVAPVSAGYTIGIDRIPYSDPPSADTIIMTRDLPSDIALASGSTIMFDSRGNAVDNLGQLANVSLSLSYDSAVFSSGTLYPSGYCTIH